MPFDGIGFVTAAPPPSNLWGRMSGFARSLWPLAKAPTPQGLVPAPAAEPDALAIQVLSVARALVEDRKDWVQRRYETRDGRRCAVGALRGAARLMNLNGTQPAAHSFLLSVAMGRGFNDIESMNDNSSHRQVVGAFDEAIARASAQYSGMRG